MKKAKILTKNFISLETWRKSALRDERAGDRGCGLQGAQTRPSSRGIIKFGGEWNSPQVSHLSPHHASFCKLAQAPTYLSNFAKRRLRRPLDRGPTGSSTVSRRRPARNASRRWTRGPWGRRRWLRPRRRAATPFAVRHRARCSAARSLSEQHTKFWF